LRRSLGCKQPYDLSDLKQSHIKESIMPPTLFLIDGHALAYRTFFAITRGSTGGFVTRGGEPTAGVFGFASVLLRLFEQEKPEYLAVAFDTGRTFRDELFSEYKATRAKMPDDLRPQMERIRQLVDAFNIPRLEKENYEADDIMGSVASWAVAQGLAVKIITGDRDLLQLVRQRVVVSLPGKSLSDSKDYFPEDVFEFLGVRPDQVVDYKALVGDTSDNIPGVPGIGEKTAQTLLKTYDTLDGIYTHLDEIQGANRKKLETGRESAYLSQKLAKIIDDLAISIDLEQARPEHFDPAQVEELFRLLEFRSLMPRLTNLEQQWGKSYGTRPQQLSFFEKPQKAVIAESPASVSAVEISTSGTPQAGLTGTALIVDTAEALSLLVDRLNHATLISFDTETTSTDPMRAELVGISLAVEAGKGFYIPIGHQEGRQLPLEVVLNALRLPLTSPRISKVGHNLKYDYTILHRCGLVVEPFGFDTMIAEWLINPASRNLGLKNLAWVRQDVKMTHIEELIGKGKKQISMAEVPIVLAADYAVADAEVVLRLIPELESELNAGNALSLMKDIELPLISVLAEMEMTGVALDTVFLANLSSEFSGRLSHIEQQIYAAVGKPFNLNSPQQLSEALFVHLKLEPPDRTAKTATGFYSTSADVLEELRGAHTVVDQILEYRELSKLKSTYLDALPLEVNPQTARVHTSYSQTGAVTGRIASSEPNLQNIPIRTDQGRQVRQAFIASPGNVLLSVDYSQVELRIVAHMANDPAMLETFRANQDIHTATAAAIYGVPLDAVTREQRRHAKSINFGLIYGMSAYGLMRTTDLTLADAENFVAAYFHQFPGVKSYLDGMRRQAAEIGYVETLLGRRRYFPGLKNQSNFNIRSREEREAINAPIQGTAADIMKIAMLRLPPALQRAGLSARMLLQVHDELVLECPQQELIHTAHTVQQVMEDAYKLNAPLKTEARYGKNWGEMSPVN
jgi:DNA polymerase-1